MEPEPKILGTGISALVTTTDNVTALKGYEVWWNGKLTIDHPWPDEDRILRENTMYKYLGEHPRILKCLGLHEIRPGAHSLRLELAPLGCVRLYMHLHPDDMPSVQTRLRMVLDVAEGLQFMHSRRVFNCDLSTRNVFVFGGLRLKIGDLGAAVFMDRNDFEWDQTYEGRYTLPPRGREYNDVDKMKRELFALGCAIYEITAWQAPFSNLTSCEAENNYKREEFPDLDGNFARDIIWSCWSEKVRTVDEVVHQLDKLVPSLLPAN